ncbi:OLC1v1000478C1 [Oldenlandia corymbosa var. corymbosa]|uniref:OLC1v1000478C1 n=1 Tax=Oldenlandia corymbosa var. corymbosa TaxID=529605 RepID=A0AAV1D2X5_OLDCO|nr:OLC1v1000478C1 [Oldenlandia corymbosa var. corymbosa]
MEDEIKPIHSEPATELPNSPPADDPAPESPSTATDGGIEPEKNENPEPAEEEDPAKETSNKRRKLCPSALEKCESIILNSCSSNPSNSFSFTFDPKFSCGVSTPEVTPKFGSFNLEALDSSAEIEVKSEPEGGDSKRVDVEDEVVVEEERRNFLDILGSGEDGGISASDFFDDGSNLFL